MKKRIVGMICILSIIITTFGTISRAVIDKPLKDKLNYGVGENTVIEYYTSEQYESYASVLQEYEASGYAPAQSSVISVSPEKLIIPGNEPPLIEENIEGTGKPGFIWDEKTPWIEWEFDVESEGLYQIDVEFYMPSDVVSPARRSLLIDGGIPFIEANDISFNCLWRDAGEPVINSIGDETRPSQVVVLRWNNKLLDDSSGLYSEPFKFYFTPGKHKVRLEYVQQKMVLGEFRVKPAEVLPSYAQVKEQYIANGYTDTTAETLKFQAESTVIEKNDPTLRRESNGDPKCEPVSYVTRKLNAMGGGRWRLGNQAITWKFTVEEDGLYKIGLRVLHIWGDGLPSYRSIAIDNKVPFKELAEYKFDFSNNWYTHVLHDSSGEPFLFYLEKGEHTITMSVKIGQLASIVNSLKNQTILLSKMIRDITKVTGQNPDPNYDYEFFETIPDLESNMQLICYSLQENYDKIKSITDKLPAMANNFMTIKSQLKNMMKNPFSIAARLNELNNALTSLSEWYMGLQEQPLLIDYFMVGGPNNVWKEEKSSLLQRIKFTFANFFASFTKNYDNIGSLLNEDTEIKTVIDVWVARGTEWAELIKEMADEDFTLRTGIAVNMNVLPAGQLNAGGINALMLAISSGNAPDVALGVDSSSPVEFAIRDAVYNLSKFESFEAVSKRFLPNIFIPYKYKNGIYAIPETMNFTVMFYRKDIIQELGMKLPDTREEIYNTVLPLLYLNGLEFFYPADFTQFIFQHGANYYTPDGMRSALDTPEAYKAVKECTELFTNYGIPVSANFFNRIRTGEMPIGIADYGMYITLSVAAPELAGKWGIAPLPGIRKEDGTIDRSCGGLAGQCDIILKSTPHPYEAWSFLDWWTSTGIQTQYAREIEALIGSEARWNTANYEAFINLSWNREDLEVITEQLKWSKEVPVVLGGYYTGRNLSNAWNRIIIEGQPVRDALEEAVEDINRELRMRQEEYGIIQKTDWE